MVENKTKYSLNLLKDYVTFTTKRSRIISYISSAIILACAIIEFIFKEFIFGGVFLAVGLFFLIFNLMMVKMALKKMVQMPQITNNYQFYPENLKVTTFSNDNELETTAISYSLITKVIEKEDVMYLYLNRTQALICDLKQFANNEDKEIAKRYMKESNPALFVDKNKK